MRQLIVFCLLLGLSFSEACNPANWTPRERQMYHCMRRAGWTNPQLRAWYNRVLNPSTRSGRVTAYELQEVSGCLSCQDFMNYGVTPDGCGTTTTTTTTTTTPIPTTTTTTTTTPTPVKPAPPHQPPPGSGTGGGIGGGSGGSGGSSGPNGLPPAGAGNSGSGSSAGSGSFYPGGFGNGQNQLPNGQKPPGPG